MKLNPLIKSENFYVGFETSGEYPKGRIYLNSNHFANFYTINNWHESQNGKIAFNREAMAIDMGCPAIPPMVGGLEEILKQLEIFYKTINK